MTEEEVLELHPGDEVVWEDPDEGMCSRVIVILSIDVDGEIVRICDADGDTVECFADELS